MNEELIPISTSKPDETAGTKNDLTFHVPEFHSTLHEATK
jgi:hypothetical protein